MPIEGCASTQGTVRYCDRFKEIAAENYFRPCLDFQVSSVGIGTYLGDADEETDRRYTKAVVRAVELGANVVDTAANYRFQRSERSISVALNELNHRGLPPAYFVLSTKSVSLPFT